MASNVTAALKPNILYEQIWKENCSKIMKLYNKNCSCSQHVFWISKSTFFILQQNPSHTFYITFSSDYKRMTYNLSLVIFFRRH